MVQAADDVRRCAEVQLLDLFGVRVAFALGQEIGLALANAQHVVQGPADVALSLLPRSLNK